MKTINSDKAPKPVGPYVQAIMYDKFLFCSGQVALDPQTGTIKGGDTVEQTQQVFANIIEVLKEAGLKLDNVIKTTVFLRTMDDFSKMNEVYAIHFGVHKPARTTIAVAGLPLNALVEIECIAVRN